MYHKTKILTRKIGNKNYQVEIDVDIVELIQLMWELGIDTSSSCQADQDPRENTKNMIHIQFSDSISFRKFMNIIADYSDPNNEEELVLYKAIEEERDFIIRINVIDQNFPIVDHPEDHNKKILAQYQRPYPNFDFNVNLYINPIFKSLIIKKLEYYSQYLSENKFKSKERLDYVTY